MADPTRTRRWHVSDEGVLGSPASRWEYVSRWISAPRLPLVLALVAMLLSSTALLLDFYLDDYIGRYIYSDREGAARLYDNYSAGYGLAIGDPVENHWQMEAGWAPWWHYEQLRLALFRPIGVALHSLDFEFWPDDAFLMHAHSLLWLGALVYAMTWMYRTTLGRVVGGLAALLFALDHTHGYAVGHICNRHALVGPLFGALGLALYVRSRGPAARAADAWLGALCYVLGLLTSESTIAIAGYVVAYALFVDPGAWTRRIASTLPYVAVTGVWRALYNHAGYGAVGSGVYIDMGREPWVFARAFLERGPVLWLGQFLTPPAETYVVLPGPGAHAMLGWALLVVALSAWAFLPLLRRDRMARFWIVGMVGSLIPAAATFPHNRQLIFASFGAMGLLAQLWHLYATDLSGPLSLPARWGRRCGTGLIAFHLIASPLALPFTTASVALTTPMHRAAAAIGPVGGRDLVFVTAPEYFSVRMVQLMKRLDGASLPRRTRAISCEPEPITVRRTDARTLEVHYHAGLLSKPMTDDLHRDRRLAMPAGTTVALSGFHVEVLHTTPDGRPERVRFTFERPLEDPSFAFYRWDTDRFVRYTPPAVGDEVTLPGAVAPLGL